MAENAHARQLGADRAGSDDLAGRLKSGPELTHLLALRQAAQRDLRFRRDIIRLHRLGARVLFEALCEFGADRLCRTEIEALVARYAAIDPERVRLVGADRWPPTPLRAVR